MTPAEPRHDAPDDPPAAAPAPAPMDETHLSILMFSWLRPPTAQRLLLGALVAACLVLAALDALTPRRPPVAVDTMPALLGVVGLASMAAIMLAAWPLSLLPRLRERPPPEKEPRHGR